MPEHVEKKGSFLGLACFRSSACNVMGMLAKNMAYKIWGSLRVLLEKHVHFCLIRKKTPGGDGPQFIRVVESELELALLKAEGEACKSYSSFFFFFAANN